MLLTSFALDLTKFRTVRIVRVTRVMRATAVMRITRGTWVCLVSLVL